MKIDKIICEKKTKFDKWENILNAHIDKEMNYNEYSMEKRLEIFDNTNELLIDIANIFYKYGQFKDKWDDSKCSQIVYGQNIYLKSIKTNHTFDWGVYEDNFVLQSYVSHPENFKYMGDDFWTSLLKLQEYGDFRFVENSGLNKEDKKYFNTNKSNLFRLLQNYFLHDIKNIKRGEFDRDYDMDLGWFEIKWSFDTKWEDLIENGCKTFKTIYNLNYQLWKIDDTKTKKTIKNNR